MSRKKKTETPVIFGSQGLWLVIRLALGLALVIAGYLSWHAWTGGTVPGCGPESDCDKVLQSRWSTWLSVPVAAPALIIYAGLLGVTVVVPRLDAAAQVRFVRWLTAGAVVLIGAALWFVGLQLFVIGSFCRFCLAAHASGLVAGLLMLHVVGRVYGTAGDAWTDPLRNWMGQGTMAGLLGLMGLVIGQSLFNAQPIRVEQLPEAAKTQKTEERRLQLHGGKFELRLDEVPVMGSPSAPHAMVSLFDYTCHHCRDTHHLLKQARQTVTNQLAIVTLPMPLDAECNHVLSRTPGAHTNACQYARLGLAVWRANREAFREFDDWLFAPASPPSLAEARNRAEQLVGRENLERELADGWVENQLKMDIAIYEANYRQMQSGQMPQTIFGNHIVLGPITGVQGFYYLLEEHLKLDVPGYP